MRWAELRESANADVDKRIGRDDESSSHAPGQRASSRAEEEAASAVSMSLEGSYTRAPSPYHDSPSPLSLEYEPYEPPVPQQGPSTGYNWPMWNVGGHCQPTTEESVPSESEDLSTIDEISDRGTSSKLPTEEQAVDEIGGRGTSGKAPAEKWAVNDIVGEERRRGIKYYMVKWENTLEPQHNLPAELIKRWNEKKIKARARRNLVKRGRVVTRE